MGKELRKQRLLILSGLTLLLALGLTPAGWLIVADGGPRTS